MVLILGSTVYVAITTASAVNNTTAANDARDIQAPRPTNNEGALVPDTNDDPTENLLPVTSDTFTADITDAAKPGQ